MTHSNTITDQKIRWFNAHTEACGYLNGLKEILPTGKQTFKPFWTSTFCMLEGNPSAPRKTYFSATIANPKVVELLKPYSSQLNAIGFRVFVTARISDVAVQPFVYPETSHRAGQLGVSWEAKIISLIALKIGDMTIELKQPTTTDFGVAAQPYAAASPQADTPDTPPLDLPFVVKLDKSEPNFEATKARLKESGYRWSSQYLAWYLAKVDVAQSDPAFGEKTSALKNAGYVFSAKDRVWVMPAAPKQQGDIQASYQRNQHARQTRGQS